MYYVHSSTTMHMKSSFATFRKHTHRTLIYTINFTGTDEPVRSYCLLLAVFTLLPSYAKNTGKENKVPCFLL